MTAADVGRDERVARAERILDEHGIAAARVEAEGHEREIAAVRVGADDWARLLGPEGVALAAEVKAAGFRYVALDLLPAED